MCAKLWCLMSWRPKWIRTIAAMWAQLHDLPLDSLCKNLAWRVVASYPGHVFGGKSGLVSTVCACANDSGNFPRTSPNTDKLNLVVMRKNNQTRYTACSVGALFTWRLLFIICRLYLTDTHVPSCQILLGSQQLLVSYSAAVTDYSSDDSSALRLATWSTIRDKSREKEWHDKDYATTTASSTVTVIVVENKRQSLVADRLPKIILWEPQEYVFTIEIHLIASSCSAFNVKYPFPMQQRPNLSALSKSSLLPAMFAG